jgi:long-subunit acyl-CoA synthetase (AMP-forming)
MVLPGQRFRVEGDGGIDGELAVKGAGVTPGFWNDLEETFARVREGWFHTGLHARKKGPFLTLYPHAR